MSFKTFTITSHYAETWQEYELMLLEFLHGDEEFLAICRSPGRGQFRDLYSEALLPKVDFLQFYSLKLFEKGELGVRELHWRINHALVNCKVLKKFDSFMPSLNSLKFQELRSRYRNMVFRKNALNHLLQGFASTGYPVPHYVEPRKSTVVISRQFARSLLEFNSSGELSFVRACFALARSSNFICIRIASF